MYIILLLLFCSYSDLFTLPEHISQCKHVLDFFRPRHTDARDEILANHKITTLAGNFYTPLFKHCIFCTDVIDVMLLMWN